MGLQRDYTAEETNSASINENLGVRRRVQWGQGHDKQTVTQKLRCHVETMLLFDRARSTTGTRGRRSSSTSHDMAD